MISIIEGDLFDFVKSSEDKTIIIAHGCNAQGKMRTGFAKVLRDKNENVFKTYKNSGHKLGTASFYELEPNVFVANCVTQEFYGYDGKKYTSYDAVHDSFTELQKFIDQFDTEVLLYFPKLGAVLGGGNNNVIKTIIDEVIDDKVTKIQFIKE
ncbi:ADP-ribose binding protein [Xanthomonas phage XaC1]|nr:ADP-ribose binding protein [Xanthomonas phage XaC1]